MRVLSASDVGQALSMARVIPLMKRAFVALSQGEAQVPARMNMALGENAEALLMPVHLPGEGRLGVKVVTIMGDNPNKDLPLIHAVVLVFDGKTGKPLALMDGEVLTAVRTGAGSGLATDLLAAPDSRVVALFGAGAQAETQLEAMCAVRPIERALVVGRNPERCAAFCLAMRERLGIDVQPATAAEALGQAQIVCTATTSLQPLFEAGLVKAGTHINAVGGYRADMCEVPIELVSRARIYVDARSACFATAGELVQAISAGMSTERVAELGELVAGTAAGRKSSEEVTLFKSVGNAVQDLVTASFVLEEAARLDLGILAAL